MVLCDTSGRLHTNLKLMEELAKCRRSLAKVLPGAPHETLLVLDGTTGQSPGGFPLNKEIYTNWGATIAPFHCHRQRYLKRTLQHTSRPTGQTPQHHSGTGLQGEICLVCLGPPGTVRLIRMMLSTAQQSLQFIA